MRFYITRDRRHRDIDRSARHALKKKKKTDKSSEKDIYEGRKPIVGQELRCKSQSARLRQSRQFSFDENHCQSGRFTIKLFLSKFN